MSTVAELVTEITAAPAPVVCLDTCAILDVARAPAREQSASVAGAEALCGFAAEVPPKVYLLVADVVAVEWSDNIAEARKEMARTASVFEDFLTAFAPASLSTVAPPTALTTFRTDLETRSQTLLNACRRIDRDPAATNAALDRVIAKRRPSHKKEVKDSYILEHYLAAARALTAVVPLMLFVSSNTSDFAANRGAIDLHPELKPDFVVAGLTYAVSIASAVALLRAGGHIP
jgi:hypothetical protein